MQPKSTWKVTSFIAIPTNSMAGLVNMQVLHLSRNNIQEVSNDAFDSDSIIHTLKLDYNNLETFPGLHRLAESLEWLYLDNNNLTVINTAHFEPLKKLYCVSLANNNIHTIEDMTILPKITAMNILNNPLQCNSDSCWIFKTKITKTWIRITMTYNQFQCNYCFSNGTGSATEQAMGSNICASLYADSSSPDAIQTCHIGMMSYFWDSTEECDTDQVNNCIAANENRVSLVTVAAGNTMDESILNDIINRHDAAAEAPGALYIGSIFLIILILQIALFMMCDGLQLYRDRHMLRENCMCKKL